MSKQGTVHDVLPIIAATGNRALRVPICEARCEREATPVSCVCPVTLGCGPRPAIVFAPSSTTYSTTALMDPGRPLQRTNRLG